MHIRGELESLADQDIRLLRYGDVIEQREPSNPQNVLQDDMVIVRGQFAMHAVGQEIRVDVLHQLLSGESEPGICALQLREDHRRQEDRIELDRPMISCRRQMTTEMVDLVIDRVEKREVEVRGET